MLIVAIIALSLAVGAAVALAVSERRARLISDAHRERLADDLQAAEQRAQDAEDERVAHAERLQAETSAHAARLDDELAAHKEQLEAERTASGYEAYLQRRVQVSGIRGVLTAVYRDSIVIEHPQFMDGATPRGVEGEIVLALTEATVLQVIAPEQKSTPADED